ncbi:hypothetical protein PG990_013970 [Apiospora arundinis]
MTAAAALLLQFPSTATAAPLAAEGAEPSSAPCLSPIGAINFHRPHLAQCQSQSSSTTPVGVTNFHSPPTTPPPSPHSASVLCPRSWSGVEPIITSTAEVPFAVCHKRYICAEPQSECAPGEPTRAYPSRTVTISCTPTVVLQRTCGCPSCTPASSSSTETAELSASYTDAPPAVTYSI